MQKNILARYARAEDDNPGTEEVDAIRSRLLIRQVDLNKEYQSGNVSQ
jgi:hypothetical protein